MIAAHAGPMMKLEVPGLQNEDQDLLHKANSYAIAPMNRANWVYLGYVPRMMDPSRVSITISKPSYTARVTLEMTEQEVAAYPQYLINRADQLEAIFGQRSLSVTQPTLFAHYQQQINKVRSLPSGDYASGLKWLRAFFPKNIFELKSAKGNGAKVIAHFVYPVTMVREGGGTAPDGTYYSFDVEERKDYHRFTYTNSNGEQATGTDYIFGGFPALWFYPSQNGIGLHGPIRYSNKGEKARDGQRIEDHWASNEPSIYNKQVDITPNYRWDLVRKKDSAGCVRSESLEIRHLLPANLSDVKRVPITMTSRWDQIEVDSKVMFVNVEYYMMDPYLKQLSRDQWFQSMAPQMLVNMNQIWHFPYLDAHSVEFVNRNGSADAHSMGLLNKAPY